VTIDGEALDSDRMRNETLSARLAEAEQRSHALIARTVVNLALAAERRGDALVLRAEADQLRTELRQAVSAYVAALRGMNVEPERMLVLVKALVDAPTRQADLMARELREDLVRTAIEAYYAA
jgi:hypothetical protein